jgi:hypothetical protein
MYMTPIEMHYSWIGFAYHAVVWLGEFDYQDTEWLVQRVAEKWFDIVLALIAYKFAKRHLEHFVTDIVGRMNAKYLDLNCQVAFRTAVTAMLPELPRFYMRPTRTFSPQVAAAIGEFTYWSTAINPTHTPEKSMELVGNEANESAEGMIEKDMGSEKQFRLAGTNGKLTSSARPSGGLL